MKKAIIILTVFFFAGCSGAAGSAVSSALEAIAPLAAETLADLIRSKYGREPDRDSAGCYVLDELGPDDDGYEYILCRAKPVE